jgi:hypothetical protein
MIADLREPAPLVQPAQAESRINCYAGEIQTERWMRN